MFFNYVKITVRNLFRNKTASVIKIASLAVGLICFAIIYLFVFYELSFDNYHNNPEQVYRVVKDFVNDDRSRIADATTPPALSPALQRDLPEVAAVTRLMPNWGRKYLVQTGDDSRYEREVMRVDSSFFTVFTFPFIKGSKEESLNIPNFILLTESTAKRYFGNDNAIGKSIKMDIGKNGTDFLVTGILKDVPKASHFTFDFVISVRTFNYNEMDTDWGWYNFYTYVRLKPGVDPNQFEEKLQPLFKKYRPEEKNEFYAQALTSIHLHSHLKWELATNGDYSYIIILSTIGGFIALLAAINYINLVTAQAARRAREVGIRKATGANRGTLVRQFLFESMVMVTGAAIISLVIAEAALPFLKNFLGAELSFLKNGSNSLWLLLGAVILFTGILSGIYPAFYLSSFQPAKVLKGTATNLSGSNFLRKGLVTFQFIISTVLICGALIITSQLDFIKNSRLGFDKDNIVMIPNISNGGTAATLETEFRKIPGVVNAGGADGMLGGQNWTTTVRAKGSKDGVLLNFLNVDENFLNVMNVNLIAGRNFSSSADTVALILNENAVKQLGIKEPAVGSLIAWGQNDDGSDTFLQVIGVIEDFHFSSFHEPIKPFGFVKNEGRVNTLFIKVNGENISDQVEQLGIAWKTADPLKPFEYTFQDEQLGKLHVADAKFQKLFTVFTGIAIIIACLGLFGLSIYTTEQRIKEIGIRKVLGASIFNIVGLLSGEFLKLVMIAILIAAPIGWYTMDKWLNNFVYRVDLNWILFFVAGICAIGIALITVSFQSIKAAIANPVDSLRSE